MKIEIIVCKKNKIPIGQWTFITTGTVYFGARAL